METDNGNIDGIVDGKEANKNTVDIGLLVVHRHPQAEVPLIRMRSLASHFENYKYTSYKLIKEHKDVMKDRKERVTWYLPAIKPRLP